MVEVSGGHEVGVCPGRGGGCSWLVSQGAHLSLFRSLVRECAVSAPLTFHRALCRLRLIPVVFLILESLFVRLSRQGVHCHGL